MPYSVWRSDMKPSPPKNYRKLNKDNCTECGYYCESPVLTENKTQYMYCGRGNPKGWKDTGFFAQFYVCDGFVRSKMFKE